MKRGNRTEVFRLKSRWKKVKYKKEKKLHMELIDHLLFIRDEEIERNNREGTQALVQETFKHHPYPENNNFLDS